jgi:hypothetical protein
MADQTPKQPPLREVPPRKEKTIEDLLNRDRQMMRSPLLWFVLLFIPVLLGLYASFNRPDAPAAEAAKAIVYMPEAIVPPAQASAHSIQRRGGGAVSCHLEEWIGKQADEQMQNALKAQKRAFRILPPGAMVTMDHSPGRANFDVDAGGKITRAWCG